jgi:lambda family phage tail tape measure protein
MADINVALVLDDSNYTGKLDAAQKKAVDFSQKVDAGLKTNKEAFEKLASAAEAVKSKMESLGGAIVGVGLVEFLKSSLESAAQMVELANSVGTTTQKMMEFQMAGLASGKSAQDLAGMIQKMNVAAQDASDGNGKLKDAFAKLGISMNDLRKLSPDEAFNKIAHALAAMEDPARRAQLATELMGKSAKMTDWGDLAGNLDKYSGTQRDAATATEAAKKVLDDLAVKAQEVRNQFVLLLKPVLEWIQPFIEGTDGAKNTAIGLLTVMTLFAGAATVVGIMKIVETIKSLATMFSVSSAATAVNTAAVEANARAIGTFLAGAYGRLGTATMAVNVAQAELNALLATQMFTAAELTAAENVLATAQARLALMTEAAAATSVSAAAGMGLQATAAGTASVAATGFAASMVGVRAAVTAAVGPIGAFVAAAGSLYAVYQATFGKEHGIFSKTGDQSGANFISDFFGITDSTASDAEAKTKAMTDKMLADQKKMQKDLEAQLKGDKPKTTVLNPGEKDLDPNAAAAQGVRNQTAQMLQNNQLAADRLRLEISLVSASDDVRAAKLAEFDSTSKQQNEELRVQGEIKRLQVDAANSRDSGKNASQINELQKQLEIIKAQNSEMGKLKGTLVETQNAQKLMTFYMEDQLKVTKEVADIRLATDELTMTNDEKKLANITKQINAQLEGAVKIRELQLGRKLTTDEIAPMKATITADWEPAKAATQDLIDKSRSFDTGWTKAWKDFADNATNEATRAKEMFDTFEKSFESVFEQMVRTGKVNWNSLLQDMAVSLMKSDVQKLFAGLTSGGGSSGGGIFSMIGSLFHASGGDIPAGQVGVVGEVRPEMVTGPARVGPSVSGGSQDVHYHINAVDAKSFQQLLAQDPSFLYALSLKGQRMLPGGA